MSYGWDYRICVYAPPNKGGHLLIETVHNGEASRDIEIAVCKQRIKDGEVDHIEVIDLRRGLTHIMYG